MASQIANDLAGMTAQANGATAAPNNSGKGASGSVQGGGVQRAPGANLGARAPAPRAPAPKKVAGRPPQGPHPGQQKAQFSASNPPLGTPMPAAPRPGMAAPFPDARSVAITLMPNGNPVMPPPAGFPLAGAIPRVPATFAPQALGMRGLLRR